MCCTRPASRWCWPRSSRSASRAPTLALQAFYGGLLWGEHPWILLHKVRTTLHGRMSSRDHDWASLVVYEALPAPPDLNYKLDKARMAQCERALLATWLRAGQGSGHPRSKAWSVQAVLARLPLNSKYVGMQALALKADGLLLEAKDEYFAWALPAEDGTPATPAEYERAVIDSCARLEEVLLCYEAAVDGFLIHDGQGMNAPYRALVAQLRLGAVLGRPWSQGVWEMARYWVQATLEKSDDKDEKMWAWGCSAELWLLRMMDAPTELRREADARARDAAAALLRLDRLGLSKACQWFLMQFESYQDWWGEARFEAAMQKFGVGTGISLRAGDLPVVDTARALIEILDKQGARERAVIPEPVVEEVAKAPPAPTPRKRTVAAVVKEEAPDSGLLSAARRAPAAGSPFFHVDMLPGGHGDALWLEYGQTGGKTSRVLVDCGTYAGYRTIKQRIEQLDRAERHFELFILSHIDADHIGGAIPLLKEIDSLGVGFGDVWFNGFKHLDSQRLSAKQGEQFSALIQDNSLPWNAWKKGAAIMRPSDALPTLTLPGGLNLTLLSPTRQKLAALADDWEQAITAKGFTPGDLEDGRRMLAGRRGSTSEDVAALAAADFEGDGAKPNGSSIAVLAEFAGKSVLLGADAHAPVLVEALALLLRQRRLKRLPLGAFKVPHHASQNNLNIELMQQLSCRDYLISTNGDQFGHPDREAIARLIAHGGPQPRLWFNYRSRHNEVWAKPALQKKYGYSASYAEDAAAGLRLSL